MDFDKIWNAYPEDYSPCRRENGDPSFAHQCAIRFGLALMDGGLDLSSFPGAHCWFGHGRRHVLRGQELSDWMESKPEVFGRVDKKENVDASNYHGLRGLIFCSNFWGTGNQGDHIDLWNRNHMKTGNDSYIARSSEVWFWEIDAVRFGDMVVRPSEVEDKLKEIEEKE